MDGRRDINVMGPGGSAMSEELEGLLVAPVSTPDEEEELAE